MVLRLPARGLDLDLTLYPSFVLSLFDETRGVYRKIAGRSRHCCVWQKGGEIWSTCPEDETVLYTGLWFLEVRDAETPHRKFSDLVDALIEAYAALSLAVDVYDPLHIFISAFLSQNTSYHSNVLRWTKKLWEISPDPIRAAEAAPHVGQSFQLARLPEAVRCAAKDWPRDPYELRKMLLNCKYVGPKTVDAVLLFSRAESAAVPVDRHFVKMLSRLSLFPNSSPPNSQYCKRFTCLECPRRSRCARWLAAKYFGRLAGWVQTAFYIHDANLCSRRWCRACALKRFCEVKQVAR